MGVPQYRVSVFVYTITNTVNGKVYVGKSCMPATRWTQHKVDCRTGDAPLYKAMRKHGTGAFEFAVVEECDSEAASYDAEQRWIARLDSTTRGSGYNQTAGGKGVFRPSPDSRAKMSAAKRGKPQSPESVARRSVALRGKKRTEEQRQRLAQSDHKYRHITPAACWELYSQGLSCRDVAERLGVASEQPVRRFLKLGGYELRSAGRQSPRPHAAIPFLRVVGAK